jgi:hypothetical protein
MEARSVQASRDQTIRGMDGEVLADTSVWHDEGAATAAATIKVGASDVSRQETPTAFTETVAQITCQRGVHAIPAETRLGKFTVYMHVSRFVSC